MSDNIFILFLKLIGVMLMLGFLIFLFLMVLDRIISTDDNGNLPVVRTEKVPCIDKRGRMFDNELCIKEITCSRWGFVTEKCGELTK